MDTVRDFLFGKPLTPEEAVKKWRRDIQHEARSIDRNIRGTFVRTIFVFDALMMICYVRVLNCDRGDAATLSDLFCVCFPFSWI
jgi:hypothetical protein